MRTTASLLLVLGTVTVLSGRAHPGDLPIEILRAKVGRYLLMPKLLSPDWFHLEEPKLGKVFVNVPAGSDINEWLDSFKGKGMTLLVSPGRGYDAQPTERILRDTMIYSLLPAEHQHNFFVGNIDVVVEVEPDEPERFVEQKRVVDQLMGFVDKEVVLIFRPS